MKTGIERHDGLAAAEPAQKEWTIMVYMAGDNNLSEDMVGELKGMQAAMAAAGKDCGVNIVAVFDSSYFTVDTAVYSFTPANSTETLEECRLELGKKNYGLNAESPRLKNFVYTMLAKPELRAKQYALIISGHSDGIMGKTTLRDSNPDSFVSLSKLRYILEVAENALPENQKFDLLGFDSCLMSMIEVGYELRNVAEIMVASQGLTPSAGWPFENILRPLLRAKGQLSSSEFARSIVQTFTDHNKDYVIGGRSVNINASNLTYAAPLKRTIDALGKYLTLALNQSVEPDADLSSAQAETNGVMRERIADLIHLSHYHSQTFMQEQAVDICDFARSLQSRSFQMKAEIEILAGGEMLSPSASLLYDAFENIGKLCDAVLAVAKEYVLMNGFSGPEYQFSSGCSVFFPWTNLAFNLVYDKYSKLDFAKRRSKWFHFIGDYAAKTQRPRIDIRFTKNKTFLRWAAETGLAPAGDDGRVWTARQWEARIWDARVWTAKGDMPEFFKQFGRFRNFDMFHDPFGCE